MFASKLEIIIVGLIAANAFVLPALAESLPSLLPEMLRNDNQIKAAQADLDAASETVKTAKGSYYPSLDITGTYGKEKQLKHNSLDTSLVSREIDLTVTQRLWDFGATDAIVDIVKLQRDKTNSVLQATASNIMLQAFTAYMDVLRAYAVHEFAVQSEMNVRLQTELEDSLVESGAGANTDILQAKVQLAGAMARRVQANGALEIAKNTYRGIFLKEVGDISDMIPPRLPLDKIPLTQAKAVEVALKDSPLLKSSNFDTLISKETIQQTLASSFGPTIDGIVDYKVKRDVGSTAGTQTEKFAKVQVKLPFNLGMTAINTLKSAELANSASNYRYADARNQLEVRIRNAWQQLHTTKENAKLLKNQAKIAAAFLELAREERKLDRRSLLDVLSGEVALINAKSDAVSAETDIAISLVTLLDAMGVLRVGDLR
jgi:TolC family type I secretion outer membrane protein